MSVAATTAALQSLIDAGGEAVLPAGRHVCGTLHLRSAVRLVVPAATTLVFSTDWSDFDPPEQRPYPTHADFETSCFRFALLAGVAANDIAIVGDGVIDGAVARRGGPKAIALESCRGVLVDGITITNAPNYAVSLLGCQDVTLRRLTVSGFSDGIDPDCTSDVLIEDCTVDTWDDAVCLKTSLVLGAPTPTERVVVRRCRLRSASNCWKIGTETSGPVRDVELADCVLTGNPDVPEEHGGVAIETVDGGDVERVHVHDVRVVGVGTPIFVRRGNRGRGLAEPVPGELTGVTIERIDASGGDGTSSVTGLPGWPVRDVVLRDVTIESVGGVTSVEPGPVPEAPADYPQPTMFGALPAHGVFARHVDGLKLTRVTATTATADARPAVVLDDVHG